MLELLQSSSLRPNPKSQPFQRLAFFLPFPVVRVKQKPACEMASFGMPDNARTLRFMQAAHLQHVRPCPRHLPLSTLH